MDKRFWGILAAVVIVFGVVFYVTNHKTSAPSSNSPPTSHVEGAGKDSVTLVEYGDYECPFCGEYFPVVKQVEAEYDQLIHFQFRNLPLVQLHKNAFAGARAAEAAALQGKFWQMHDALYEAQDPNGQTGWVASNDPLDDYFVSFAQQLGLNIAKFKTDFASDQVNNIINADVTQFAKDYKAATGSYNSLQDEATPTFFLDNTKISPSASAASFEQLINAEIKKKTGKDSGIGSSSTTPAPSAPSGQSKQ